MTSDLVERLERNAKLQREWDRWELNGPAPDALHHKDTASVIDEAAARITEIEKAVEQAFRDGLAYGSNVENADPDIAWGHSRARAALGDK